MDQLSMFDAQASAKPPKPTKYATSSTRPCIIVPPSPKEMLPTKPKELIELIRSELLPAYDVAVTTGNAADQVFIRERIRACVHRHGTSDTVLKAVAAPAGKMPSWGQPGTKLKLRIAGCDVSADYTGAITWGGFEHLSTRAVSETLPFYSPSGFQAFSYDLHGDAFIATGGLSLDEWLVATAEAHLRSCGDVQMFIAPFTYKIDGSGFDLRGFTPKAEVA